MEKYLAQELSNKLLLIIKPNNLILFKLQTNFLFSDVKLIKNLINFELIAGIRPKFRASYYNNKITISLVTLLPLDWLIFLQKTPISWNNLIDQSQNITTNLFPIPVKVKNQKLVLNLLKTKFTKLEWFIKSAYLD